MNPISVRKATTLVWPVRRVWGPYSTSAFLQAQMSVALPALAAFVLQILLLTCDAGTQVKCFPVTVGDCYVAVYCALLSIHVWLSF